jgi:hypothetical protein
MSDVRQAIERVGARWNPSGGGLAALLLRRNRVRTRRRIAAGAFAITVAAGGGLVAVRAFLAPASELPAKVNVAATWPATFPVVPPAANAGGPPCPTPSGEDPAQVVFSPTSGPAGSSVEVSGLFETGDLWFQLWWNADWDLASLQEFNVPPPPWPPTGPDLRFGPAAPGPVVELASVAGPAETGDCSFRTEFTVPETEPGTYQLVWVTGTATPPSGEIGYAVLIHLSPVTFEVTG